MNLFEKSLLLQTVGQGLQSHVHDSQHYCTGYIWMHLLYTSFMGIRTSVILYDISDMIMRS